MTTRARRATRAARATRATRSTKATRPIRPTRATRATIANKNKINTFEDRYSSLSKYSQIFYADACVGLERG